MDNIFEPIFTNGIPVDLVYFLLIVPFIVMVGTFARHVLGLKIFTMFVFVSMTMIIGLLIRENSWLSMSVGIGLLVFIYFFSYFVKKLTNTFSLHYYARISLVVSMISILLLSIVALAGRNQMIVESIQLDKVFSYAIILGVLLSEFYSSNQTQKGFRASRVMFLWSICFAFIIGSLISWNRFEGFMLKYPFIVIIFMLLTYLFGNYKGLRFSEIRRFKDVEIDS
jgi:hypothetical protein